MQITARNLWLNRRTILGSTFSELTYNWGQFRSRGGLNTSPSASRLITIQCRIVASLKLSPRHSIVFCQHQHCGSSLDAPKCYAKNVYVCIVLTAGNCRPCDGRRGFLVLESTRNLVLWRPTRGGKIPRGKREGNSNKGPSCCKT